VNGREVIGGTRIAPPWSALPTGCFQASQGSTTSGVGALDHFLRDFPSYRGKNRGGDSTGTNGVNFGWLLSLVGTALGNGSMGRWSSREYWAKVTSFFGLVTNPPTDLEQRGS
jgi:hypothetical protein